MIKEIVRDSILLGVKSELTTKEDLQVARDLFDTLTAHKDSCVGVEANMIGVRKRIIVFDNEGAYIITFNSEIIQKLEPYVTEKTCLSPTEVLGMHPL